MPNESAENGLRGLLGIGAASIMFLVLCWKAVQLFIFLPLSGADHIGDYLLFALELALGIASLVLSLLKRNIASSATAMLFALTALWYWWFVICGGKRPIWSDFAWLTVPDFLFAAAALLRWIASPTRGTNLHQGPMEADHV
jgi:hypothetical protein